MKTTIWKYSLNITGEQILSMPKGAKVLCVQMNNGQPCIWAFVKPDAPKESRQFLIIGTGHSADAVLLQEYIGTFQVREDIGTLVFHVFAG